MIEGLTVPRILDLSRPEDRRALRDSAEVLSQLQASIDLYLGDYLRFFPEADYRTIHGGGVIAVRSKNCGTAGTDIMRMLRLTEMLMRLEDFEGFSELLAGFRNPTQFDSSCFEVAVADWCTKRDVTESIVLSPSVVSRGKRKHPDLLWRTTLGDLYCECKRENALDGAARRRVERLMSRLEAAYRAFGSWDPDSRVDVSLDASARDGVEQTFHSLLSALHATGPTDHSVCQASGVVRATYGSRSRTWVPAENSVRQMCIQVGNEKATSLNESNAHLTLTMSITSQRLKMLSKLVRQARQQLPDDGTGALFIAIGGGPVIQEKLEMLLSQNAYESTPWASLWRIDTPSAYVWKRGQSFDDRLIIERR